MLKVLKSDGWVEISRRGSHRQLKHRVKKGRVTVPGKPSDNLAPGDAEQYPEAGWPERVGTDAICDCNRGGRR